MSAASTHINKRKRVDEDADIDVDTKTRTSVPVRSASLWLEDGNIIFQAEGKQFKVYRGLLSLQSTVFNDMFSVPQPSEGDSLVEGCPVVHLSDAAADLEFALEAIFLRKWVAVSDSIPITVVGAFLRLGDKYEIEALRAEAFKRLFFEFPSDIFALNKIYDTDARGSLIQTDSWTWIDAANLAREHNLLSVLPTTLYWCCRKWSVDEVEEGQRRADGTIATLSPVNERACFRAYSELLKLKENTWAWALVAKSADGCIDKKGCSTERAQVMRDHFFPTSVSGCLQRWKERFAKGLCLSCATAAKKLQNQRQIQTWDALPGAFGLPDWEELVKDRGTLSYSL